MTLMSKFFDFRIKKGKNEAIKIPLQDFVTRIYYNMYR
jgi:hypothetical protein